VVHNAHLHSTILAPQLKLEVAKCSRNEVAGLERKKTRAMCHARPRPPPDPCDACALHAAAALSEPAAADRLGIGFGWLQNAWLLLHARLKIHRGGIDTRSVAS
jgi:hypothetical protein